MSGEVKTAARFEKLVKVRIGEPLTAVEVNKDSVVFGSISGYVGSYSLLTKDLFYI